MSISATHRLRRIGIILFVLAVISYGLFQARNLIEGPIVIVTSPENGATIETPLVEIAGEARNISEISLNSRRIFINEGGHFREQLLLPEGYTIMTLTARDRFGRTTTKTLEVVRTP